MTTPYELTLAALLTATLGAPVIFAVQEAQAEVDRSQGNTAGTERSPLQRQHAARRISASDLDGVAAAPRGSSVLFPAEFQSVDGADNNLLHAEWGMAGTAMQRLLAAQYADGAHAPAGQDRPSARAVSNLVVAQPHSIPNSSRASDFVWLWGQFVDHDLTETPVADPAEPLDIEVPLGDAWFDPFSSGLELIPLDRSGYDEVDGVRQQVNLITAFIDASNVYGSDMERALELRALDGTGRLRTSAGDLLPYNVNGLPNAPNSDASYFLAGDVRANEQVALTAMHTLFVREHNHWAERLGAQPGLGGDTIYQLARAIVAAELQAVTYREFLPALLGPDALREYRGYDPRVDPSIANEFAAAAYRFGHSMLSPQLLRVEADGSTHVEGHLSLASAFFAPTELSGIGLEPYLRGLSRQRAQEVDPYLIDEVRNFLFGPPGSGGFDLAALNIQRGRDHGLPSYNDLRVAFGQRRATRFAAITSSAEIQARLARAYGRVDDVDAWVGLLAEDHAAGGLVGPTLRAVLVDQFERLRTGDRFWYEAYLGVELAQFIEQQTLAVILRRNTGLGRELQDDVFHVAQGD